MRINNPTKRIKELFASTSKKGRLFFLGLTLFSVLLLVAVCLYFVNKKENSETSKIPNPPSSGPAYKEGPGDDPNLVVSYHQEAVKLWKVGKKQEARQQAQKGLDVNDRLTIAQQQSIPSQSTINSELFAISEGNYSAE